MKRRGAKAIECTTCGDRGCPDCFVCLTPGCQCARAPVAALTPSPAQLKAGDVGRWLEAGRVVPQELNLVLASASLTYVRELSARVRAGEHLSSCRCPPCEASALLAAEASVTPPGGAK